MAQKNNNTFWLGFGAGAAAVASMAGLGYLIKSRPVNKAGIMYSYPNNPRAWKAMIVARMTGQRIEEPAEFEMGVTNKQDWFMRIHPKGQVPALAIGEAEGVFESNSIARYMARGTALYGQDDLEASRIDAFLDVALQLEGQLSTLWYKKMETPWSAEYTPEFLNRQRFAGLSTLQAFEKQLSFGDYLVGDDITLADIVLFCVLVRAFEWNIFDDEELQEFPHIVDHFGRIGANKDVAAVVAPQDKAGANRHQ